MNTAHKFVKANRVPRVFCAKCGIMDLNNPASQKVIRAPCKDNRWDDGDYEITIKGKKL